MAIQNFSPLQLNSTLTVGVDDTSHDVTFFGATSGKKMLWDQSADTLIVDGTLDVNGDATVLSGAGSGSLTVGRNANENMVIYVDDSNTTITGVQDSDTNSAHSFILNRTFLGSGANNFIIQKGGTAQLTLDTNSAATFASTINSGAITSTGQITGTELEGTSLDINGDADISGNLTGVDSITASATVQAEHLYSTDDLVVADDASVGGDLTVDGTTYGIYHSLVEDGYYHDDYNGSRNLSIFYKNARADIIRYQAVDNYEYWNGSAWVADANQESNVEKLLDGRQDTYWSIPERDYKFRFTTNTTTGWPTQAMIWMQTSWSGSTYPGATMLVEETADATADTVVWVTKVTAEFTSGNKNTNWGLHARADGALHTGNGDAANETRITIDFYGWSPSNGSYATIPLQNLMITSNYAGTENTDYTNLLSHDKHLRLGDNRKFIAGTSSDLQIYHDGSNSYIVDAGVGDLLNYFSNDWKVIKYGSSEICIAATSDGAVDLYYDNSKKLETVTGGVLVTGELEATTLDINGNADISGNLTGVDTLTATTFSGNLNGTINTATTAATQSAGNNSTKVATTAYVDGARVQQIVNLKGYATLQNDVFDYANPYNTDDEAPFQLDVSYGSGTINSSTEVSQSKLFRSGGFHVPFSCTVSSIQAQLTCNNDGNVSIALVEYRPSDAAGDTSDYPRVVYETVVVDSANNNNKVSSTTIATDDLDNTAIPAGSHLMIMVKGDGTSAGGTAVFSVAIGLSW